MVLAKAMQLLLSNTFCVIQLQRLKITYVKNELLIKALKSVDNCINGIKQNVSEDFLTIDLMDAYEALGSIIGESVEDDLADRIFKDFCMGK